jgi:hypothetical protein
MANGAEHTDPSIPNKRDDRYEKEYEINIDLWKHYDNLRQEKNKTFLTSNSILFVALGFILKDIHHVLAINQIVVAFLLSATGVLVCILWVLLLTRNAKYIEFHRKQGMSIEATKIQYFTTFRHQSHALKQGMEFNGLSGNDKYFEKPFPKASSLLYDKFLSISIGVIWFLFGGYFLFSFGKYLAHGLAG